MAMATIFLLFNSRHKKIATLVDFLEVLFWMIVCCDLNRYLSCPSAVLEFRAANEVLNHATGF